MLTPELPTVHETSKVILPDGAFKHAFSCFDELQTVLERANILPEDFAVEVGFFQELRNAQGIYFSCQKAVPEALAESVVDIFRPFPCIFLPLSSSIRIGGSSGGSGEEHYRKGKQPQPLKGLGGKDLRGERSPGGGGGGTKEGRSSGGNGEGENTSGGGPRGDHDPKKKRMYGYDYRPDINEKTSQKAPEANHYQRRKRRLIKPVSKAGSSRGKNGVGISKVDVDANGSDNQKHGVSGNFESTVEFGSGFRNPQWMRVRANILVRVNIVFFFVNVLS